MRLVSNLSPPTELFFMILPPYSSHTVRSLVYFFHKGCLSSRTPVPLQGEFTGNVPISPGLWSQRRKHIGSTVNTIPVRRESENGRY